MPLFAMPETARTLAEQIHGAQNAHLCGKPTGELFKLRGADLNRLVKKPIWKADQWYRVSLDTVDDMRGEWRVEGVMKKSGSKSGKGGKRGC